MKIRPIKKYPKPMYPDKEEANNNPELLKQMPQMWRKKSILTAAVIATFTTGMFKLDDVSFKGAFFSEGISIPIFEHGDGRGAFGCLVVAAPVFLSEEEARQVILDEASNYGLTFKEKKIVKTKLPLTPFLGGKMGSKKGELELDGYDETGIGFEYVSYSDYKSYEKVDKNKWASVSTYDMKEAAKIISENTENTAVFYDPITFDDRKEEYLEEKELKEMLRNQVRDFIEWLIGQGII